RPLLEPLEDRLVPAVFDIGNFDVPALVAAINTANANGEADTINLAPGGSYFLLTAAKTDPTNGDTGLPVIAEDGDHPLTINGNGATILRAPGAPTFRIFEIAGQLTLDRVTIANGDVVGDTNFGLGNGGGIFVGGGTAAALVLANSAVLNNKAATAGGGIHVFEGSAMIINCTISGHSAFVGGGIEAEGSR